MTKQGLDAAKDAQRPSLSGKLPPAYPLPCPVIGGYLQTELTSRHPGFQQASTKTIVILTTRGLYQPPAALHLGPGRLKRRRHLERHVLLQPYGHKMLSTPMPIDAFIYLCVARCYCEPARHTTDTIPLDVSASSELNKRELTIRDPARSMKRL